MYLSGKEGRRTKTEGCADAAAPPQTKATVDAMREIVSRGGGSGSEGPPHLVVFSYVPVDEMPAGSAALWQRINDTCKALKEFAESLAPTPLPSASHASGTARQRPVTRQASNGAEVVGGHPLRARSFRAAADPRWLLCGASGSSSLFALPWGRASTARTAEATFPTAVELLCAPSLTLDPPPQSGVRGIHKLGSDACRAIEVAGRE